tara:strand:- start:5579 stop:6070 length:492 start_codon:yes stop_codon:yes gene_type:complete
MCNDFKRQTLLILLALVFSTSAFSATNKIDANVCYGFLFKTFLATSGNSVYVNGNPENGYTDNFLLVMSLVCTGKTSSSILSAKACGAQINKPIASFDSYIGSTKNDGNTKNEDIRKLKELTNGVYKQCPKIKNFNYLFSVLSTYQTLAKVNSNAVKSGNLGS